MTTRTFSRSRVRSLAAVVTAMLVGALALAGCSNGGSKGLTTDSSGVTKLRLGKTQDFLGDMPLYAAQEFGYFKDNKLDVEITTFESGSAAAAALVSGDIDLLGPASLEQTVRLHNQGQDVKAILGTTDKYFYGLVAKSDSKLSSLEDLRGKKVAITGFGASTETMMRAALTEIGMNADDDVKLVTVGNTAQTLAALAQGQIAAGMIVDPVLTQKTLVGDIRIIDDFRTREFPSTISARASVIKDQRSAIERFTKAIAQATDRIKNDKDAWMQVYEAKFAKVFAGLNLTAEGVDRLREISQAQMPSGAKVTESVYQALGKVLESAGSMKASEFPPFADVVDGSLMP